MKKAFYLFLCCMLAVFLGACEKYNELEEPNPDPVPDIEGLLIDGGRISKVGLYCLKDEPMYDAWYNYYPKVKTLNDYSDMASLCILLHDDRWTYTTDNL